MARPPAKNPKRKRVADDDVAVETASGDTAVELATPVAADGAVTITLAANCSIKEVAVLREQLLAAAGTAEPIAIDGGAVERIDTATLQLLFAFVRDRLVGNRDVTWQNVSSSVTDAARLLGVRDLLRLPAAT